MKHVVPRFFWSVPETKTGLIFDFKSFVRLNGLLFNRTWAPFFIASIESVRLNHSLSKLCFCFCGPGQLDPAKDRLNHFSNCLNFTFMWPIFILVGAGLSVQMGWAPFYFVFYFNHVFKSEYTQCRFCSALQLRKSLHLMLILWFNEWGTTSNAWSERVCGQIHFL